MKRILALALIGLLLCSCSALTPAPGTETAAAGSGNYNVIWFTRGNAKEKETGGTVQMKGIWISQFDMHPIWRDESKQREQNDYAQKVDIMLNNLKRDGFNTLFLQIRPNGDSVYDSKIFPNSKYVAGVYGGKTDYDAVELFLSKAKAVGFSVHAWINPFRLCSEKEFLNAEGDEAILKYKDRIGSVIKRGEDGLLYLDPAYSGTTELIAAGVKEILLKYGFDGIHIDDYFYPTEFELDDSKEFLASGYADIGDFRRDNIDRNVKAIYTAVHQFPGKTFGISPAGNIYSLRDGWYADVYKWCAEEGYADYIMPQLYFGFKNACCPFEQVLSDWADAMKNRTSKLYIGLSAAKCVLGSQGLADPHAGENGKYEWRDEKDILARSIEAIGGEPKAEGYCIFCYSSLYDPVTGEDNRFFAEERSALFG
ncbi:MAG: family 10 glycosylhydrolase [Clostridia bacterium]|nr:family 10 glycosylhydrolase [Clostridia bacterium]